MKYKTKFNENKDLNRVVPNLSISIKESVETGAIKDTGYIPEYNGIESTDKIIGRVRDNFEAVEAMKYVSSAGRKQAPPTAPPTEPSTPTE